ncbi:MAG: hypothetical protein ABSF55_02475 [Candidatus Staskawiczbacteria bacterium]|jgi:deoxyribonuclease-4
MSNIKFGLKLWSIDSKDLFEEAGQLFKRKEIDFVELYIVPDSLLPGKSDILNCLRNIPTTIHAPHMEHNFDVFTLDDSKIEIFKNQVIKIADFLNSKFIVVHAMVGDSQEIFKKNIIKISDPRILIENSPKIGLDNRICSAHSYDQLESIKDSGCNLCLDFSHAIKSAAAQNIDYKKFIEKLIFELDPSYFHLCNGKTNNVKDEHRDLFDGEFDLKWIKNILLKLGEKKDVYLVFETPKGKSGLLNDIKNMKYFRSI